MDQYISGKGNYLEFFTFKAFIAMKQMIPVNFYSTLSEDVNIINCIQIKY